MDKIEKMEQLVKAWEKASNGVENGIAAMFGATEESEAAFNQMWDYARKNGFVDPFTSTITERPILKIYANSGVLAHEKQTVYTYANKESDVCEEIYIEVPEGFKVYDQSDGMGIILSTDDGYDYTVDELLGNINDAPVLTKVNDAPVFKYVGKDGGHRTFKCKVLEAI